MNKITQIYLNNLELKTFTEQDIKDYCQLNNINLDDINSLFLNSNELTDISGIKLFKNLKYLDIGYNKIKDISVILNLNNLQFLNINYLELESDQIQYIIKCKKNLKYLKCLKAFKESSVLKNLRSIEKIHTA